MHINDPARGETALVPTNSDLNGPNPVSPLPPNVWKPGPRGSSYTQLSAGSHQWLDIEVRPERGGFRYQVCLELRFMASSTPILSDASTYGTAEDAAESAIQRIVTWATEEAKVGHVAGFLTDDSQDEISSAARTLGVYAATVRGWHSGRGEMSLQTRLHILTLLGIRLAPGAHSWTISERS